MRLHTGSGTRMPTDWYWRYGRAVWNDTGDTVYLYNSAWALVDRYGY